VVECDRRPIAGVMAGIAGRGEARRGVRGVGGPAPIRLMAAVTACRCSLKVIAGMAGSARKSGVYSSQRVACVFEMVELGIHPSVHRVAGFACYRKPETHVVDNRC
jgi:hypothetical protein